MWHGGVRIIIRDEQGRVLLVRQEHAERWLWLLPGGAIEEGETAPQAAVRETLEETGLQIEPGDLRWFAEDVSESRGQRFVLYFESRLTGGTLRLGRDPELDEAAQVLRQAAFFRPEELAALEGLYPPWLATELASTETERRAVYRTRPAGTNQH